MIGWDDIAEGLELAPLVKPPIDRMQLVKYAGASSDFNRIHYDDQFAREGGYPRVFAHGMLIMGCLGQLVSDFAGGPRGLVKLRCRFRAITWPGDVITCHGRVTRKDAAARTIELALQAVNQEGNPVADGAATVRVE